MSLWQLTDKVASRLTTVRQMSQYTIHNAQNFTSDIIVSSYNGKENYTRKYLFNFYVNRYIKIIRCKP